MSTNPLHRQGGYWKPVLDHEYQDDASGRSSGPVLSDRAVRNDLCRHCGSEFVVDSPFCRMCGKPRGEKPAAPNARPAFNLYKIRRGLGLSLGASICFFAGLACLVAALVTGLLYSAASFTDWQAIQEWRGEWLLAAGVAFLCGLLLNSRRSPQG